MAAAAAATPRGRGAAGVPEDDEPQQPELFVTPRDSARESAAGAEASSSSARGSATELLPIGGLASETPEAAEQPSSHEAESVEVSPVAPAASAGTRPEANPEHGSARSSSSVGVDRGGAVGGGDLSEALGLPLSEADDQSAADPELLVAISDAFSAGDGQAATPASTQDRTPCRTSDDLLHGQIEAQEEDDGLLQTQLHAARTTSIDEPLLVLDEDQQQTTASLVERLRAELAEARSSSKAEAAALSSAMTEVEHERDALQEAYRRLQQDNRVLSQQLQNHHGIMATDWEQTLEYKERLRTEEAMVQQLSSEVHELRFESTARAEEAAQMQQDAAVGELLRNAKNAKPLAHVSSMELEGVIDAVIPGLTRLQAETRNRARRMRQQLAAEQELRLCVVCRDEEKCVLFLPCRHICVCEGCRARLRRDRCPMCQEPVQQSISRVHY